jgi:uncharacterized protein involved in exopolysaccharide biosynthesis
LNSPSGEESTPDSNRAARPDGPRFRFPLPFDPVRLLAGVLSRWPWIVIGMTIFGTIGTIIGIRITHPSFEISASLIKRRVPQTVQTSETGQAYRPVDLNDATLLATLLASEPLDLALKRTRNGVEPERIRLLVEANQLEGTDIFFITYHSPLSPEDAVEFTTIWAEEINSYTQRLQQTEAREVRLILQKEVADLEKQIDETDSRILAFSKEKDYLGGVAQVSAALAKLAQIELQLETARTTAESKAEQLANLTDQIRRQSPIDLQLKTAKEELANLRATYTDANPLVQAKLQSIDYLTSQAAKNAGNGETDYGFYTGTQLGNQLYLSILDTRNELLEANSQIHSLEKIHKTTSERIAEFPGIISAYDALQKKRATITEGLSLMSNRLKEAEIFASGAPGYWQVFQTPDPRSIIPSSLIKKPIALGAAAGIAGGGIAVLLTLLLTHRTSRRSILECCAATHAPLVACIPTTHEENAIDAIKHFWITRLSPRRGTRELILFWTPALDPADERRFWSMLSIVAFEDTRTPVRVLDLTPDTLWEGFDPPASLEWNVEPSAVTPTAFFLRASSLPHGPARERLARVDFWMAVVSGQQESLRRAATFRSLTDAYLPPCNGTIGWTERPEGPIRQAADVISGFLTKRFS